jgi:hypothetical protein
MPDHRSRRFCFFLAIFFLRHGVGKVHIFRLLDDGHESLLFFGMCNANCPIAEVVSGSLVTCAYNDCKSGLTAILLCCNSVWQRLKTGDVFLFRSPRTGIHVRPDSNIHWPYMPDKYCASLVLSSWIFLFDRTGFHVS